MGNSRRSSNQRGRQGKPTSKAKNANHKASDSPGPAVRATPIDNALNPISANTDGERGTGNKADNLVSRKFEVPKLLRSWTFWLGVSQLATLIVYTGFTWSMSVATQKAANAALYSAESTQADILLTEPGYLEVNGGQLNIFAPNKPMEFIATIKNGGKTMLHILQVRKWWTLSDHIDWQGVNVVDEDPKLRYKRMEFELGPGSTTGVSLVLADAVTQTGFNQVMSGKSDASFLMQFRYKTVFDSIPRSSPLFRWTIDPTSTKLTKKPTFQVESFLPNSTK